ncbi:MAG: DegV family protein [Erysipelotrichaceae bacterium]
MKNIRIVTDTTSTLTYEQAKEFNIELVSLSVLLDGKEYKDFIDMSGEDLNKVLKNGGVPTTSQPNIGYVREKMLEWKEAKDDAIIIISISSGLSGTYQGFKLMADQLEMKHVYLVDSKSVAAPIMDAARTARKMADQDAEIAEILEMLDYKFENTTSYLYPHDLVQLKKGGRISPLAANMASMLKIKPLLVLAKDGSVVDKYGMARTESKIFDMIIKALIKDGVDGKTHNLYIPHVLAYETAVSFAALAKDKLNSIQCVLLPLPAVLTCHGGLGCMAVQSVIKHKCD